MKFADLDEHAKDRARDSWRENQLDDGWWGDVYEDAVETAKCLGIEVGTVVHGKTVSGRPYMKPDIWFSGFYCQGDGCCFSGTVRLKDLEGAVEKVKAHAPMDETLASLAAQAEAIWQQATTKVVMQRLDDNKSDDDDDYVSMNRNFTITGRDRYYSTKIDDIDNGCVFLEDDLNSLVSGFADWIYRQLEAEHDYLTSDEAIDESIEANEAEFDEEGCAL